MRRLSAAEGRETSPVCIRLGKCAQGPDRQHQTISELTNTLSFFFLCSGQEENCDTDHYGAPRPSYLAILVNACKPDKLFVPTKHSFVSPYRENNRVSQSQECAKLGHLIAAGQKRPDPVEQAHEERTTSFIRRAPQLLTVWQLLRMFR